MLILKCANSLDRCLSLEKIEKIYQSVFGIKCSKTFASPKKRLLLLGSICLLC